MGTTDERAAPVDGTRRSRRREAAPDARRVAATPASPPRRSKSRVVLSAAVMTLAAGLVATIALPSYAVDPSRLGQPQVMGRTLAADGQQRFNSEAQVSTDNLKRDMFSATSSAVLLRRAYARQFSSYSGPTAADYLQNPAHPPFSLNAVYSKALEYRGVPYVFGGSDPSGFDCSGFIRFVYAQFGVELPHSVTGQDAVGKAISPQDAQIGDIVIFNDHSHDGFYAGNGMILHAPYAGAGVRVQQLWTSNVHFVRVGI